MFICEQLLLYCTLELSRDIFKSIRGIIEFSIESLELKRLLPTKKLFGLIVLKVVCLDVKIRLIFKSIQSFSGHCELYNLCSRIECL